MWVLAGVPLAVALIFGFVYLRTAGAFRARGRSLTLRFSPRASSNP